MTYQSIQKEVINLYKNNTMLYFQTTPEYVYLCDGYQATRIERKLASKEIIKFIQSHILKPLSTENVRYKCINGDTADGIGPDIHELFENEPKDDLFYTGLIRNYQGTLVGSKVKNAYIFASDKYYVNVDISKFVNVDFRTRPIKGSSPLQAIFLKLTDLDI